MSAVPKDLGFTRIHNLVVESRLVNQADVDELAGRLRYGEYCLILGPRFSEKSFLLADIARALQADRNAIAIAIDLESLRRDTGGRFIRRFAAAVNRGAGTTVELPRSERQLVHFLQTVPATLERHVILLLDHLELLPVNDILILLRALRGVFTEQRGRRAAFPVTCAATTSFAVADLTFGPNSPFNEGHKHWVGDLSADESRQLFTNIITTLGVRTHEQFYDELFAATRGDRYLIALLCHCCARIANKNGRTDLSVDDLHAAEQWFLDNADRYPPLQETIRALEQQPHILRMFMQILAAERIDEKELEIRADESPDALRLTGGVRWLTDGERTFYEPRNELYRRHMERHYIPTRVARVSFMAGRIVDAIHYLQHQPQLREDRRLRRAFLDAVVTSIYAALTVEEAVDGLAERIVHAFDVQSVAVYTVSADFTHLECVSAFGRKGKRIKLKAQQSIVFREGQYRMRHEKERLTLVLTSRRGARFGVIDIHGFKGDAQSEDFSVMLALARQIGWALGNVLQRERLIRQLQTLDATGRKLSGSLDLKRVLEAIVEAGIEAVPGAQRGLLLLYDETEDMLRVESQKGYRETIRDQVRLRAGQGYAGTVFQTGEPMLLPDAQHDPRVLLRDDEDIGKQKSVVCVPLLGWGRRIGVFILDNVTDKEAFRPEDQGLLSAFAAQAASALQNAMVYRELYQLSLAVNRGSPQSEDIFRQAVRSIVHVTGAFAANMLLLRDTDDPALAVRSKPIVSVAHNMSPEFEQKIRPRPDGLTFRTLSNPAKEPLACPSPDHPPGINPAAYAENVRALIALPLTVQEQTLGVLYVYFSEPHEFPPEEQHVLSIFANLCAEAIETARHAEQLRVHASVAWMGLDLSEMGHSIAQAIPPLRANLAILEKKFADDESAKPLLARMSAAIDGIAALPNRAGHPSDENIRAIDLAALVKSKVAERCVAHKMVKLDLDGVRGPAYVRCDPQRLAKVLKSLTENAVRAVKAANDPRISVTLRAEPRTISVTLTNTGSPIPDDVRRDLFRKPVRSCGDGKGIGLLIARSVLIGYGGDLEALPPVPGEISFRISLPAVPPPLQTEVS